MSDNQGIIEEGTVSIQYGAPTEPEPNDEELSKIGPKLRNGNQVLTVQGNEAVEKSTVTQYQVGQGEPEPTSILETARTPFGSPASEITPDTIVTVTDESGAKMETTVAVAAQMGMLRKTASGGYEEATPQAKAEADVEDQPEDDSHLMKVDQSVQDFVDQAHTALGESTVQSMINALVGDGEVSDANVRRYATDMGIEPEQFHDTVTSLIESYENHFNEFCNGHGADPEGFNRWLSENVDSHELMSRLNLYVHTSNTKEAFGDFLETYRSKTAPVELPDGAEIVQSKYGRSLVRIPDVGEVEASVARKHGLI